MSSVVELSHEVQASPEKRKAGRVQRACHNCRRRKQGCDEERPCKRCVEKGIECVEVEIKRKKTRNKQRDNEATEPSPEYAQGIAVTKDYSSDDEEANASANGSTQPEGPSHGENASGPSSSDMEDAMEEIEAVPASKPKEKDAGMNLARLLPFLVNVASATSSPDMDLSHFLSCEDIVDIHTFTSDFPFYSPYDSNKMDEFDCPDTEERMKEEMFACWRTILRQLQVDEDLRHEFRYVKDLWKQIMKCLHSLEWHKVQSYLESMDKNYLYNSPPLVFWSSGGRIHHANQSFCRMTGYNVEDLRVQVHEDRNIGIHGIHSLFHPEEIVSLLKRQLEATQYPHKSAYYMRTRLMTKYRQEIAVSAFVTNLRDSVGGSLLSVAHFAVL